MASAFDQYVVDIDTCTPLPPPIQFELLEGIGAAHRVK